jgi:hypothetical protein
MTFREMRTGELGCLAMAILVALVAPPQAKAQLPVERQLAQVDSTFACPESLSTDQARQNALALFLDQVAALQPNLTLADLIAYRVTLLRKHRCFQTLRNITAASASDAVDQPGYADGRRAGLLLGAGSCRWWPRFCFCRPLETG